MYILYIYIYIYVYIYIYIDIYKYIIYKHALASTSETPLGQFVYNLLGVMRVRGGPWGSLGRPLGSSGRPWRPWGRPGIVLGALGVILDVLGDPWLRPGRSDCCYFIGFRYYFEMSCFSLLFRYFDNP